jgi:hypothetical protein
VFDLVSEDVQRQRSHPRIRFRLGTAVDKTARKLQHLGNVAAIRFTIELDGELHGVECSLRCSLSQRPSSPLS